MLSSTRPFLRMRALYPLFRPLLFGIDPETAHALVFRGLDAAAAVGLAQLAAPRLPPSPVTVMGITFPNRVGLAAGRAKKARPLTGSAGVGFGFFGDGRAAARGQAGQAQNRDVFLSP